LKEEVAANEDDSSSVDKIVEARLDDTDNLVVKSQIFQQIVQNTLITCLL